MREGRKRALKARAFDRYTHLQLRHLTRHLRMPIPVGTFAEFASELQCSCFATARPPFAPEGAPTASRSLT